MLPKFAVKPRTAIPAVLGTLGTNSNLNVPGTVNDTAFSDPLDESIASAIVSNGQTEGVFCLLDLNFFTLT
jgi:hypothetical protein